MIKENQFCHLHIHDQYSQLDGFGSAKQYVDRAVELGFEYLGSTNHGNIDGLIQFQKACAERSILPVSGCELYIVPDASKKQAGDKRGHIIIWIKDKTGFDELCRMLTYANLDGFYRKPRIGFDTLRNADKSGWVISTACVQSFVRLEGGRDLLHDLSGDMDGDVYAELMPHDDPDVKEWNNEVIEFANELGLPLIGTNDCHYIHEDDAVVQEVLLAIQRGAKWTDKKRWRFTIDGLHLRNGREMFRAFKRQRQLTNDDIDKILMNTLEVAKKCADFRIEKQPIALPKTSEDPGGDLHEICNARFTELFGPRDDDVPFDYWDRYQEEYELIERKEFCEYFLIVKEVIDWCKEKDIMVGPGRGSVGGCLIAYLMGITKIDPIQFNLSFSRFISEDRIDWPDIDIDFEKAKRPLVRKHLEYLYGENNVCGISTFMSMKSKAAIRDVGRVFNLPADWIDDFAKSIPLATDIAEFVDSTGEGKDFYAAYPDETEYAIALDGQIRGSGQHPAAVVISSEDLTKGNRGNLCRRSGKIVANWDMSDSEHVGLIKLDVLGLGTLSVISEAQRLIRTKGCLTKPFCYHAESECYLAVDTEKIPHELEVVEFHVDKIPLDDPLVFEAISSGNTGGMFQISAYPTTTLCQEMQPESFDDVVAAIALVRPGAADIADLYIKRKHGERYQLTHPIYDRITEDTYGLLIYQEQIMQVISQMAGLPESTADKIRKVIGKKRDPKEFKQYEKQFIDGCQKEKSFSGKEAKAFWKGLQKWANYGFNKAHSVEYALIAYWTAWLKVHYPAEFYCALLTFGDFGEGMKSKRRIVNEAKEAGYDIMPPKVGRSHATSWLNKDQTLYAPFAEVKGIGPKQAIKCCNMKPTKETGGFFEIQVSRDSKTKIENLMDDIGAFDDDIPEGINEFFEFNFFDNRR